ncbi:hypothetical protein CUJ83_06060 [Methanocella sp. CWC-04]|uniref:histidine kinase n=1 Tax=Methanooceanicella nereidis TaxID=2052831 RepID=A0AAP2REG1_9EURY|nr:GAF domain-containing protein [Methanocella sp. CWC-04]MCD1294565.1 hypothetical protein [Methanocella sp. CWC-04]
MDDDNNKKQGIRHSIKQPEDQIQGSEGSLDQYLHGIDDTKDALSRFEAIFENTPLVAIQGFNKEGIIFHWNNASEMLYGYRSDEAIGKNILEILISPGHSKEFEDAIKYVWECGKAVPGREWDVRTKDGRHLQVYSTVFPVSSRGSISEAFCMDVNVTDYKRAEEELRKARDELEIRVKERTLELTEANRSLLSEIEERKQVEAALLESLTDLEWVQQIAHIGIWTYYPGEGTIEWSDETYRIFGLRPQEYKITFERFLDFVYRDDVEALKNAIDEGLKNRRPRMTEIRIVRPDGSERFIDLRGEFVFDEKGDIVSIYGTAQDVTERKSAQENLKLDESRLEALLELSRITDATMHEICDFTLEEGVKLTGSKIGYLAFLSEDESVLTMYAWSRQGLKECEVTDKPILYPVKGTGLWGEAVRQRKPIVTNDYSAPSPYKKGVPDGHVNLFRHMNVPIFDGDRIVIVAGVANKERAYDSSDIRQLTLLMSGMWNILQRKRYYEELLEAKEQAELYVDLMGHDINNMNQIAIGYLEYVLDSPGIDETSRSMILKSIGSIMNCNDLIENVEKLQRVKSDDLHNKPIDISVILNESISRYLSIPDRKVSINFLQHGGCTVLANELVKDIFSNILGNSIKHAGGPINIDIRADMVSEDEREFCRITIEDNGPGIPDDLKSKLFTRSSRGNTFVSGRGLGLYLVRALVETYHGKVWVEDRIKGDHTKGCKFIVMLPASGK